MCYGSHLQVQTNIYDSLGETKIWNHRRRSTDVVLNDLLSKQLTCQIRASSGVKSYRQKQHRGPLQEEFESTLGQDGRVNFSQI